MVSVNESEFDPRGAEGAAFSTLPTPSRDRLGEGPWWSVEEEVLFWVDIWGRKLRRCALDGSRYREWALPSDVGFAVPSVRPDLVVVGLASGLHVLNLATSELSEAAEPFPGEGLRINDGKTDRAGRLWFGTIREDGEEAGGHLYRYDAGGLHVVRSGVMASNGLAWSPDDTLFYYDDSATRRIDRYSFDPARGVLGEREDFALDPEEFTPDGLTVDVEGCVWSPKWDGSRVVRYAPDGSTDRVYRLPVRRPTSCAFVGKDLDVLAVTSATSDEDGAVGAALAGSVFLLDVGVRGIPEARVADAVVGQILNRP